MGKSKIEYVDMSWNPITGCDAISPGCTNCYARRMANRLRGRYGYPQDEPFKVTLQRFRFCGFNHNAPEHWKKSRRIFVCSMGDLFHEDVTRDMFMMVWNTIQRCSQHTFIILTKRPKLMRFRLFNWCFGTGPVGFLPNVWLGVTAENQEQADKRIPLLLRTPAAVRFVSVEPMLGPVDMERHLTTGETPCPKRDDKTHCVHWWDAKGPCCSCGDNPRLLDWVICGAETGPGKRPMNITWAQSLRDQCVDADVPFFFKRDWLGGRELDGQLWEQYPERSES